MEQTIINFLMKEASFSRRCKVILKLLLYGNNPKMLKIHSLSYVM
jgi:hypothetical protein